MRAVQFGAGNIGRGFIGAVLEQAGYHVVYADVNQEVINLINEKREYTVLVKDVDCIEQHITNISAVNSTTEAVVEEIAKADIVTTAVGVVILPRIARTRMQISRVSIVEEVSLSTAVSSSEKTVFSELCSSLPLSLSVMRLWYL